MHRFQFHLSTLLWITLAVACFFFGVNWNRRQLQIEREKSKASRAMLEMIIEGHNERWGELLKEFNLALELGMIRPNDEAKRLRAEIEKAQQPNTGQ